MEIKIKLEICPGDLPKDNPYYEENYDLVVKEVTCPGEYVVCSRCRGEGQHVNPAIDGNGLSHDDFNEDPEFAENYFGGVYDVECEECAGDRVIPVPNQRQVNGNLPLLALFKQDQAFKDSEYETNAIYEAERRLGA